MYNTQNQQPLGRPKKEAQKLDLNIPRVKVAELTLPDPDRKKLFFLLGLSSISFRISWDIWYEFLKFQNFQQFRQVEFLIKLSFYKLYLISFKKLKIA